MNEAQFAADFLIKNFEKILAIGAKVYGKADEILQVALKTAYTNYLVATQKKYSRSRSFFIRHEPTDLYSYYVPTGIKCEAKCLPTPTFRDLVTVSKKIAVIGSGGSGKSVLMKHLFLDCIKDGIYAPILIELRDLNSEGKTLDDLVLQALDEFGFDVSGDYVKRAKQAGHFCYILDGIDEISPDRKQKVIREIKNLSRRFSDCPIIISSRPEDSLYGMEDFTVFSMMPLELDSAITLVVKLPFDANVKAKFIGRLETGLFEQHKSFLSNPLLLSIMLLTYSENAEIPTKLSVFYNQAYEALFQRHDAYKGGFSRSRMTQLDIQDFARIFSLFALQTYEKRLFRMPRTLCLEFIAKSRDALAMNFKPDDYLSDLISAACLMVEDGLEIAFSHRSFQEYFVARHISQALPDVQAKLIDRYWPNMRDDNVVALLLEINPDLVERDLLVPKLEALFRDIGVKRAIGITHAARFFKAIYSELSIDDEHVRATFHRHHADSSDVMRMAIKHCGTYAPPSERYFKEFRTEYQSKHGKSGEVISFPLKELSVRSPVLRDLFHGRGTFSIEYLRAGFRAFRQIKSKHANTIQNLDSLLGIKHQPGRQTD